MLYRTRPSAMKGAETKGAETIGNLFLGTHQKGDLFRENTKGKWKRFQHPGVQKIKHNPSILENFEWREYSYSFPNGDEYTSYSFHNQLERGGNYCFTLFVKHWSRKKSTLFREILARWQILTGASPVSLVQLWRTPRYASTILLACRCAFTGLFRICSTSVNNRSWLSVRLFRAFFLAVTLVIFQTTKELHKSLILELSWSEIRPWDSRT